MKSPTTMSGKKRRARAQGARDERAAAARKIQALHRGRSARKKTPSYLKTNAAQRARRAQTVARRKQGEAERRRAAEKIQAITRGRKGRKAAAAKKKKFGKENKGSLRVKAAAKGSVGGSESGGGIQISKGDEMRVLWW